MFKYKNITLSNIIHGGLVLELKHFSKLLGFRFQKLYIIILQYDEKVKVETQKKCNLFLTASHIHIPISYGNVNTILYNYHLFVYILLGCSQYSILETFDPLKKIDDAEFRVNYWVGLI